MEQRLELQSHGITRLGRITAAFIFVVLFVVTASLHAQTTGTIFGTVTDPSGAVVPKAKITLKNQSSGDARETVSNGEGAFSFGLVVPGAYDLMIEAQGFKSWQSKGVQLNPGDQRVVREIKLAVGSTSETVSVEAVTDAPVDSGERSALLNSKQI